MIPRRVFAVLTTLLIVLTVTVAAVMSAQALLNALGDAIGARVASGIGFACLTALAIDVLLLAGALGIRAMQSTDEPPRDHPSP